MRTFFYWFLLIPPLMSAQAAEWTAGQARLRLDELLQNTRTMLAADSLLTDLGGIGPTECQNFTKQGLSTFLYRLSYNISVTSNMESKLLLRAIQDYWQQQGFQVSAKRLLDSQPEILARSQQDLQLRALAVTNSGVVNIAGDTPCLPF